MRRELQGRFLDDYQRAWRDVLQQSSVGRGSGLAGVREVVQAVSSGTSSPVLRLLQVVAVQTGVTPEIQAAFQPVRQVATADLQGKLAAEKAAPYLTQLAGLGTNLGALEAAQRVAMSARDSATVLAFTQQALLAAGTATVPARGAAAELVQGFAQGAMEGVGAGVERLLTAPIADVEMALQTAASLRPPRAVARGGGGGGGGGPPPPPPGTTPALLNARGQSFCSALGAMTAKFPFAPTAVEEASPAEVARLLAPGTGELWTFHGDRLAAFLVKEGGQWVARPAAGIALSPAFVTFFNQAARLSDALFVDGGQAPRVGLRVVGLSAGREQTVTLLHGGKESRFGDGAGDAVISWPTDGGLEAKVSAVFVQRFARNQRWDLSASGDWALFRLTARARSVTPDGTVTWATGGRPDVVLKFTNDRVALPLLRRGWMGDQLGCVAQVTQ
jgi:type VI secretion system protein ImpL